MSSFYEDASLVMIPSGYKTSKVYCAKPTDGAGDLTFTRSNDTATRVASNGLIEKVRTNLILQSNTFSTTWSTSSATITGGQAGYDGTNNAWELNSSASGGSILQSNTQAGLQTFSVYAKGSVSTGIRLYAFGSVNFFAYFNLNTGAVGSASAGVTARIQSVGGGWYRCSISFDQTNTQVRFYTTDNNNANAAGIVYIQNAQLEAGDIATPYIATTSAAVSVGPVANVPRLDYLNSSCPRLLLEPQRQNVITFSEQMDNAAWNKIQSSVTANAGTSPDGYTNADKFIPNTSNVIHFVTQTISSVSASWTYSIFAKAAGYDRLILNAFNTNYVGFNLTSGIVESSLGTGVTSANIENYGNGWYRCSITSTSTATGTNVAISVFNAAYTNGNTNPQFAGNGTDGILIYGAQLEQGSYSTSLIPTLGAAVTRGADAASKTGISSLIGQTEGTLFCDFDMTQTSETQTVISVADGTSTSDFVLVYKLNNNILSARIRVGGVDQPLIGSPVLASGRHKLAFAYKQNDLAFYVDGVLIGTSSSANIPSVLSKLSLNEIGVGINQMFSGTRQALLFKTRLSNSELAALTTL